MDYVRDWTYLIVQFCSKIELFACGVGKATVVGMF